MSTERRTVDDGRQGRHGPAADLEEVRRSAEFEALRRSFRRVVFPTTAAFLAWYALYVLLAAYAPGFMGTRLGGSTITVGLLLGLGQFVTTFAITMAYRSWADRSFDTRAEALRARIAGGTGPGAARSSGRPAGRSAGRGARR